MRGTYKYECEDCGFFIRMNRNDRTKKGKIICPSCGGHWWKPSKRSVATNRIMACNEAGKEQLANYKKKQNFRPIGE